MITSDMILNIIGFATIIPFLLLLIGGAVIVVSEIAKEVIDMWKPINNTDTNTQNHNK